VRFVRGLNMGLEPDQIYSFHSSCGKYLALVVLVVIFSTSTLSFPSCCFTVEQEVYQYCYYTSTNVPTTTTTTTTTTRGLT
jgi:hypothetical protein